MGWLGHLVLCKLNYFVLSLVHFSYPQTRLIVTVELLKAYCLPFLLYVSESVSLSASQLHFLNHCINRAVHKIFGLRNAESINDVRRSVAVLVENRRSKFIDRLIVSGKHVDLCLAAVHIFRWFFFHFSINICALSHMYLCTLVGLFLAM